ncbi:hypothetical protein LLG46_12175, partial [bacterium]|nr:hypothetical protein [bacterium]
CRLDPVGFSDGLRCCRSYQSNRHTGQRGGITYATTDGECVGEGGMIAVRVGNIFGNILFDS